VIAADGIIQWAANLTVDESSLTGESEPQSKRPWKPGTPEAPPDARFFAGSLAVSGHGFGNVTDTGAPPNTEG
jgi:sodium/potassium-transporting ATPase subunit alpha